MSSTDAAEADRQQIVERILPIVFGTKIRRSLVLEELPEDIPGHTAHRIAENLRIWAATGDWPDRQRTREEALAELAEDE